MKPLSRQVVVITGASSGIGRCAALHMAGRGARVALFARGREGLESLAEEIRRGGGECIFVTGDVSREEDVDRLARETVAAFGRIDTWVNNAAVFIQGRVEDIEPAEFRRVIEVNLLGTIFGSRRALQEMKPRGEGVIVQVSSIVGQRGAPYFSAYSASKRAIDGFTGSMRAELWGSGIEVSTLYLPAVDTAIYQHARGKFGTQPEPAPPVYDPEDAAREIAELAESGDRTRHIGWFHHLYVGVDRVSQRLGDWFLHRAAGYTVGERPSTSDNLYAPATELPHAIRGGWGRKGWRGFTVEEAARTFPLEIGAAATVVVAGVGLLARAVWSRHAG